MFQLDASPENPCTCLLFMKPTANIKKLLERWMRSIVDDPATYMDQVDILVTFWSTFHSALCSLYGGKCLRFSHDDLEDKSAGLARGQSRWIHDKPAEAKLRNTTAQRTTQFPSDLTSHSYIRCQLLLMVSRSPSTSHCSRERQKDCEWKYSPRIAFQLGRIISLTPMNKTMPKCTTKTSWLCTTTG